MLQDLISERLKKLEEVKNSRVNPYPARTKKALAISKILEKFSSLEKAKKNVFVAGRIWSIRDQGGLIFWDLKDERGQIQILLKKATLKDFSFLKKVIDRGDFVSVSGLLFKTKRGEKSLEAKSIQILTKSVRPLPTEWFGVEDVETRLRKRYIDLLLNSEAREIFRKKAIFWATFRNELGNAGFLEVETPVLEAIPGGAEAEPFKTHHNALDTDFYLRISLELPLKKLLVGGFEKVFEIGRIFRNEGIDREHLQDYTQLEFYWAYSDYTELMKFTEKLYKTAIKKTTGGLTTTYQGQKINWGKKWGVVDYVKEFEKANKLNPVTASREELMKHAENLDLKPEKNFGKGRLTDLIYKKTVRPKLVQPCFLINPPVEIEPLAKRFDKDDRVVERFQIMAGGTELGKGFSELNDPIDQRKRFEEQMKLRVAGDKEAQIQDDDFLEALEYGMPPACGFGVSERLFAVILDKPVRETVIFPLMRGKS
ncbi:MAG: lysyl-tRNA synthetase [Parcubacteria group bacterium Gr01-1014_20]|nr:MAG: lysyl-tRNA synthetase [Parcubacteria group bacterium Gr01-1014_20]